MRSASETSAGAIVSPDGRYEVVVEETADRFEFIYDTILIERLTGRRLFTCQGEPRAEFAADGMLTVHYPGYEPNGLQIDPGRAVFRTHHSEPWVSLEAWPMVEAAYGRGWAQAFEYKSRGGEPVFPAVTLLLLLACVAALPLLTMQKIVTGNVQLVLLLVAGAGVLFFGWLMAVDIRSWLQSRRPRTKGRGR